MNKPEGSVKTVDVKADLPTADQALRRLVAAIDTGRLTGATAVKIVHGYGSTGKGGKIRTESRRLLEDLRRKGKIRDFLPGEEFSIFHAATLRAFERCPALRRDSDLDQHNNGITIILL
ncbi:MAG: Smr/MutS family protein [Oscillospiraceae bacterium]|jgi:hypothetical protein|nr:Smr/MutS family protein [Oscillospiraceae bacterium]